MYRHPHNAPLTVFRTIRNTFNRPIVDLGLICTTYHIAP